MATTTHDSTEPYLDDKADVKTIEHAAGTNPYSSLTAEDADFMRSYEGKKGKGVIRKIDLRLIPIMALLYLCSHIDRGNIGNAKIEGMDKDLEMTGNQYNIASTIFFIPYIIFEIPSNIVLKKLRPSIWLSVLVISWGIVITLMGVVQNFQGMVACRVFLGLCEAGFFPGAVFIVSSWYPRHELQQRLALFYTASAFSGALSGLLAFAIAGLDGARGIRGWRWIFLIEGAVTVAIGLCMPFLLADTPERASWLTDNEKRFVDLRLRLSGVRTASHAAEQEVDQFSWRRRRSGVLVWHGS
ncbi:transporter [Apiospora saccharicola]|uniref:Transporter n=1 Tax=Apiospora saccharicola TaxID=335842 RepID=A0ABR1VNW7_9PEZI